MSKVLVQSPSLVGPASSFEARWLLMPKLLYFWLNMAIYSASSFIAKFFKDKWAMQKYQIAFMMSLQIVMFFGAAFWTNLADRLLKPRRIVMAATLGYICCFSFLGLSVFTGPDQHMHRLIYSSIVVSLTWACSSGLYPVIDSTILNMLSRDPAFTKDHYNNQRLWGVPAHVMGILISGYAMDRFGTRGYQAVVFSTSVIFAAVAYLTVPSEIEPIKKHEAGLEEGAASKSAVQNPAWRLLMDPNFVFFLLFGISAGILRSSLTNFQTLHMETGYKKSGLDSALTSIPRIASEVLVYTCAKHIAGYCGVYWMLILSQITGLIRIFGYAFAPTNGFWQYLPFVLEVFKGLNSGLFVSSTVRIASDIAPRGCESSAQGLFTGTYTGLSMFIGGLISGSLLYYSNDNLFFMFKWVGLLSLSFTALFFIKYAFYDRLIKVPFVRSRA